MMHAIYSYNMVLRFQQISTLLYLKEPATVTLVFHLNFKSRRDAERRGRRDFTTAAKKWDFYTSLSPTVPTYEKIIKVTSERYR
jgi:hypothetical protein